MPVLSARLCAYLSEELRMRTQGRTSSGETVRRFGNAARRYEKRRGNRAAVHGFDCAGSGRTTARHSRGQHEFSAVRFAVQMSVLRNAWAAQAFKWGGRTVHRTAARDFRRPACASGRRYLRSGARICPPHHHPRYAVSPAFAHKRIFQSPQTKG